MRKTLNLFTLFVLLAAGAAQAADTPSVTLNRYTGTDRGYGANAYWLESKEGIVLVDALFLRPDAELLATLIASRQKPLAGIILTHPHVDHFGGLAAMRRRFPGVKIYATRGTADGVRPTHEKAYADGWIQAYGTDYDAEVVAPDTIVESGRELNLAGMSFILRSLGPMEASDNTVVYNKELDALFVGDALVNGGIYYLGEGRSASSIEAMLKLGAAYPATTTALPGHSDPGNLQLIVEENVAQVRAMRRAAEAMAARADTRTEKGTFRDVVRARLLGAYGELLRGKLSYGLTVDMIARMNLAGLERELLGGEAK